MATPSGGTGSPQPSMGYTKKLESNQNTPEATGQNSAFGFQVRIQEHPSPSQLPRINRPREMTVSGQYLPFTETGSIQSVASPFSLHSIVHMPPPAPNQPWLWSFGGLTLIGDPLDPAFEIPVPELTGPRLLPLITSTPGPEDNETFSRLTATAVDGMTPTALTTAPKTKVYQPASPDVPKPDSSLSSDGRAGAVVTKVVSGGFQVNPGTILPRGFRCSLMERYFSMLNEIFGETKSKKSIKRIHGLIQAVYRHYRHYKLNIDFKLELLAFHLTIAYKMLETREYNEAATHLMLTCGCVVNTFHSRWKVSPENLLELTRFINANNSIYNIGEGRSIPRFPAASRYWLTISRREQQQPMFCAMP